MLTTNDLTPTEFPDEISRSSKKAKHWSRYIQLPEELIYEVFLRLPVKSLIRFRCLSKGMHGMIDSSNFIKNHNNHRFVISSERDRSLSDDDYAIFLYQPWYNRLFSVNFDKEDNNLNRAKAIQFNCTFAKEGMTPLGWCCNGIFCFKNSYWDYSTSYVFWNPSNGTFRKVDPSSCLISANVSMGYDYVNDDYKIIRFIVDTKRETSLEVYSFRKDSWRKFRRDFHYHPVNYKRGPIEAVCLSGVMHWLWTNHTDSSIFIAAFDLVTEAFTSLPLPLEARHLNLQPCNFTDFGGRLCITFFPSGYGGAQTVWVMEKYGVESSWTKLYSFDHTCTPDRIPSFYFPNSRRRLLCTPDRIPSFYFPNSRRRLLCNFKCLSWWDPQDHTFDRIEFRPSYDLGIWSPKYIIYVRNLVRLDQSWE